MKAIVPQRLLAAVAHCLARAGEFCLLTRHGVRCRGPAGLACNLDMQFSCSSVARCSLQVMLKPVMH